jgi:hypothetical protein
MGTVLRAGINGSTRGSQFRGRSRRFMKYPGYRPYNEPHSGGIQRKTQRVGDWGLWIGDCGLGIENTEKSFIVYLKIRFSGKDGWSLVQKSCD